ncbi:hypothetical protein B0H10DRAFT_2045732, partial [Mycena sp. CBHHK59/15]
MIRPLPKHRDSYPDTPVFNFRDEELSQSEISFNTTRSPKASCANRMIPPNSLSQFASNSRHSSPHGNRRHSPDSSLRNRSQHREPVDATYYIIPGGMNVIFQDENGNEITRVGDFSGRRRRISPIIVQDEYGRELYRTGDVRQSRRDEFRRREEPVPRRHRHDEDEYRHGRGHRSRSEELYRGDTYSQ